MRKKRYPSCLYLAHAHPAARGELQCADFSSLEAPLKVRCGEVCSTGKGVMQYPGLYVVAIQTHSGHKKKRKEFSEMFIFIQEE